MNFASNKRASSPKVSICVVAYNQEKYIGSCLQSIVDQQTSFNFEIIVGDDCSKDGTAEIIRKYSADYPELIRPIYNDINVGIFANLLMVHKSAKGEYVCHCDGDDYFIAGKLQAQADAMDENPKASMAIHKMIYLDTLGRQIGINPINAPLLFDLNYLVRRLNFIPHSSKMYRKSVHREWPKENEFIDFQLHINDLAQGPCIFLPIVYGVYRVGAGVSMDPKKRSLIDRLVLQALSHAHDLGGGRFSLAIGKLRLYLTEMKKRVGFPKATAAPWR
jgi:glycosyltransferase involved in cell wall biosynthesis